MIGVNKLELCKLELLVAIQEYLDKRLTTYAPVAIDFTTKETNFSFVITVKEKDKPV